VYTIPLGEQITVSWVPSDCKVLVGDTARNGYALRDLDRPQDALQTISQEYPSFHPQGLGFMGWNTSAFPHVVLEYQSLADGTIQQIAELAQAEHSDFGWGIWMGNDHHRYWLQGQAFLWDRVTQTSQPTTTLASILPPSPPFYRNSSSPDERYVLRAANIEAYRAEFDPCCMPDLPQAELTPYYATLAVDEPATPDITLYNQSGEVQTMIDVDGQFVDHALWSWDSRYIALTTDWLQQRDL
jgi:hypothetical protein